MTYVLTQSSLEQVNIDKIVHDCKGDYFHISPTFKKLAIINLGMENNELMKLADMKFSINVFDKDFNINQLMSLSNDIVYLTNGKLSSEKMISIVNKIKNIIGKKILVGRGLGKEIIDMAAKEKNIFDSWEYINTIKKNSKHKMYLLNENNGNHIEQLFGLIE